METPNAKKNDENALSKKRGLEHGKKLKILN